MDEFCYQPPQGPAHILYHDADIALVNKPPGLLSVPGKHEADCLLARLAALLPGILLVHRLDMDTSGLMIFAMNKKAQRHLGLQFERRHIKKSYWALVDGHAAAAEGEIDLPIKCDWPNRPKQMVSEEGRAAQTSYRVIARHEGRTELLLFPHTGRSHQLRVHMQALGHPICGDRFYNGSGAARLMLHALALGFYHPADGRWLDFCLPIARERNGKTSS